MYALRALSIRSSFSHCSCCFRHSACSWRGEGNSVTGGALTDASSGYSPVLIFHRCFHRRLELSRVGGSRAKQRQLERSEISAMVKSSDVIVHASALAPAVLMLPACRAAPAPLIVADAAPRRAAASCCCCCCCSQPPDCCRCAALPAATTASVVAVIAAAAVTCCCCWLATMGWHPGLVGQAGHRTAGAQTQRFCFPPLSPRWCALSSPLLRFHSSLLLLHEQLLRIRSAHPNSGRW